MTISLRWTDETGTRLTEGALGRATSPGRWVARPGWGGGWGGYWRHSMADAERARAVDVPWRRPVCDQWHTGACCLESMDLGDAMGWGRSVYGMSV